MTVHELIKALEKMQMAAVVYMEVDGWAVADIEVDVNKDVEPNGLDAVVISPAPRKQ